MEPDTPITIVKITITAEDVRGIVEEIDDPNITFDLAMDRAISWARHIEETASSLVNEQLVNVIRIDYP